MNTLIKHDDSGRYYLTDELTANALADRARDEPFYAYLSNKKGERLSTDMIEVKIDDSDWYLQDEDEDDF